MEVFLGTIMPVGFNFAPRGWALCNGQQMSIAQNSALFSLLGTQFGGNGQTTFGLPDLRGRVIVGAQAGQAGPGLQPVQPGEMAGSSNVTVIANGQAAFTLDVNHMPAHTHTATSHLQASTGTGGTVTPAAGSVLTGTPPAGPQAAAIYLPSATAPTDPVNLGGVSTTVENTGGGQQVVSPVQTQAMVSVMQPYTGINYIIALEGIFPARN